MSDANRPNVILVGMPGAGKSTVGVVLAKRLGYDFVDTDLLLQTRGGRRLQQLIDQEGLDGFLSREERLLLDLDLRRSVIATGGSAVYGADGMAALKRSGLVVFLEAELSELQKRIRDMDTRGVVIDPGESFEELYRRRQPLYRRWADHTVEVGGRGVEEIAARITELVNDCLPE